MDSMDIDDDVLSENNVQSGVNQSVANDTSDKSGKTLRASNDLFIAEGVYTDCESILKEFLLLQTSTFEDFGKIWKEKKFTEIYTGKDTFAELLEFSEEVLTIAKSFILPPHSQIKRIGALYLMYGLYTQQPLRGSVKYRVTPQEWSVILKFVENLKMHGFIDANYIFHKLSYEGAFLTVANAREYGLERNYRKYLMPWPARDQEHLPEATYSLETLMGRVYRGSLKAAAEKCRSKYNNIKVLLEATHGSKFQHVHGADVELDKAIQENLEGSINPVDSLGITRISVGHGRKQIKDKAFAMPAQHQSAQSSQRKDIEIASSSQSGSAINSEPNVIDLEPEQIESESDDSDFQYIIRPPSKRNSRKQKQRKIELSKKRSEDSTVTKKTRNRSTRKFVFEEVTGVKPTAAALQSNAVPKVKAGRKKGSKIRTVAVDSENENTSLDESQLIVDVPVKNVKKTCSRQSSQASKSLPDIETGEGASSSSTVRRSLRAPKRKKAFSFPEDE